jgi:hypothetical protein
MFDKAMRLLFADLSTFFLVVAVVTIPLHMAHAFLFRGVIEISPLHPQLETFPESRLIGGVGKTDLAAARTWLLVVTLVELALLPLVFRATRAVVESQQAGEVPRVWRAWLRPGPAAPRARPPRAGLVAAATGLGVAVLVWWLARTAGLLATEFLSEPLAYLGVGLTEGVSRALALPFFLVPVVLATRAKGAGVSEPTTTERTP